MSLDWPLCPPDRVVNGFKPEDQKRASAAGAAKRVAKSVLGSEQEG